ncbi:LCP family protein, partial [Streptomyces anthocyanicus]
MDAQGRGRAEGIDPADQWVLNPDTGDYELRLSPSAPQSPVPRPRRATSAPAPEVPAPRRRRATPEEPPPPGRRGGEEP